MTTYAYIRVERAKRAQTKRLLHRQHVALRSGWTDKAPKWIECHDSGKPINGIDKKGDVVGVTDQWNGATGGVVDSRPSSIFNRDRKAASRTPRTADSRAGSATTSVVMDSCADAVCSA